MTNGSTQARKDNVVDGIETHVAPVNAGEAATPAEDAAPETDSTTAAPEATPENEIDKNTKGITYVLAKPITIGENTISELHMRRPTAGDLRGLKLIDLMTGGTDEYWKLLPRILTPPVPAEVLEPQINVVDFVQLTDKAWMFLNVK